MFPESSDSALRVFEWANRADSIRWMNIPLRKRESLERQATTSSANKQLADLEPHLVLGYPSTNHSPWPPASALPRWHQRRLLP